MRAIILNFSKVIDILPDEDYKYIDKVRKDERDEEAITFFEKNYPDYCEIIDIPDNITDYWFFDEDDFRQLLVVIDGKIKELYYGA